MNEFEKLLLKKVNEIYIVKDILKMKEQLEIDEIIQDMLKIDSYNTNPKFLIFNIKIKKFGLITIEYVQYKFNKMKTRNFLEKIKKERIFYLPDNEIIEKIYNIHNKILFNVIFQT